MPTIRLSDIPLVEGGPLKDTLQKGIDGELALNEWLKSNSLPYVYVAQSPDTFATMFPDSAKRPDFLVLLQSVGLIAVDAKNYTLWEGLFSLSLERELKKMITFERLFRIPVWFAYMSEEGKCWYWISGLKAIEVGELRQNQKRKERFMVIKKSEFAEIRTSDDLGKLYTQKILSLKNLHAHLA